MSAKHLTEEALLALAGKQLSVNASRAVEEHLAACDLCRQEYEEFRFAHSVVARMAEIGYQEALGAPAPAAPVRRPNERPRREFHRPWRPMIGFAVGCICVMAFLLYPRFLTTASAKELLSNAMQNEDRVAEVKAFRVQISGQTCAGGRASEKMVSFDSSVRCGRALQHIQNTPWGRGNPLSARTYAAWRSSLERRHDRVTKRGVSWELKTTAEKNPVHTASLELRASDYHATKLTLDFADDEEVSISEETEMTPSAPAPPVAAITANDKPPVPEHIDDPGGLLEVQAWTVLHQMNADSGWEAVVLRNGPEVRVKAVVHDDDRKQELEKGFAAYPDVVLEVHSSANPGDVSDVLPNRTPRAEDARALATNWLSQQFVDADARAEFSNRALRSSQAILGRAFILDKLRQRQAALAHCSCVKEMSALIATEKRSLGELETGLSTNLEPMFGTAQVPSSHVLTPAEAMGLDASLHELLWRSSDSTGTTFDSSVEHVRRLLAGK